MFVLMGGGGGSHMEGGVESMVNQVEQSLPTVEVEKVATHELG